MLLKLHVRGFKNLRDVEVRFGPLTCFVGPNGVGKSNLFDAIQFLRRLADEEIQRAAESIRKPAEGAFSPLDLFWCKDPAIEMRLVADMLVPLEAEDDFGQRVVPTASLLTYGISLRFSSEEQRIVLASEELKHHRKSDAKSVVGFPHTPAFRDSVIRAKRFGKEFISTTPDEERRPRIQLHQDGGSRGRAVLSGPSPRTILGGTGSKEHPTVVAARREMASWRSLHLEPSSLRTPDMLGEKAPVDEHGKHIAATLRRLAREQSKQSSGGRNGHIEEDAMRRVCATAANQLARLVERVKEIRVREDEARQHHVVEVRFRDSDLWMPPRALSDGTLRFLALVAMQMDAGSSRVLCIEEPENGIAPSGVPQLVELLREYAVDSDLAIGMDNPLRQVVLNSHSPQLVRELNASEVLFVESVEGPQGRWARMRPVAIEGNWRGPDECISAAYLKHWVGGAPKGQTLMG